MTPKEKAIELFDKYDSFLYKEYNNLEAKKCALIAVDDILNCIEHMNIEFNLNLSSSDWKEVKQEIEKL